MTDGEYLTQVNEQLDLLSGATDEMLSEGVVQRGACMRLYADGRGPRLTGDASSDRALTAPICTACPVRRECLEWEMRSVGADTQGPWGALGESDRRDFFELWSQRRGIPADIPDGFEPGGGER